MAFPPHSTPWRRAKAKRSRPSEDDKHTARRLGGGGFGAALGRSARRADGRRPRFPVDAFEGRRRCGVAGRQRAPDGFVVAERVPVLTRPRLPLARPAGPRRGRNPSRGRRLRPSGPISLRRPSLPRPRTRPCCGGPRRDADAGCFGSWPTAPGQRAAGIVRRRRMQRQSRRLLSPPPPPPPPSGRVCNRAGTDRGHGASWRAGSRLARPPANEPARLPGPRPRRSRSRPPARPRSSRRAGDSDRASAFRPAFRARHGGRRMRPGRAPPRTLLPPRQRSRRRRDASEAADPSGAGGQGASAPLQGAASANPFGAASSSGGSGARRRRVVHVARTRRRRPLRGRARQRLRLPPPSASMRSTSISPPAGSRTRR